jgi:hypothetical protein
VKKITSLLSMALVAVAVSACQTIETPDGKIPAEYVDAAKKYEGTYHGHFDNKVGDLTLKIEGTTPVLTYTDSQGNDIMGKGCGSSIGLMKSVTVDGDPVSIQDATFMFNPGYCGEGHNFEVSVSNRDDGTVINVSVVKGHYEFYVPGQVVCQPAGPHHHPVCYGTPGHYETRYRYAYGSFKKSN